ncbi:MAG: LamG-like jellyroll fold domain-containing protein [Nocardioidaceae bacterium]
MKLRLIALGSAFLLGGALLTPGVSATAAAPAAEPTTVTAQPLPTWQTNGAVYAVEAVGDVVYVGGNFTAVRPPGAAPGTGEVPRRNLAAFDADTGDLLPFSHDIRARDWPIPPGGVYDKTCSPGTQPGTYTCDTVYEIRQSPDAATLYIGGDFETIDGKARPKLASFTVATDALTTFRVWATNSRVRALAVTADRLYYGGYFTSTDGRPRQRLAAVDRATGAVTGWAPTSDGTVFALAMAPDGSRVLVGGDFDRINGTSIRGVAAVDAETGENTRWDTRLFPGHRGSNRSYATDLAVDGDTVYAASNGEGSFDGRIAYDPYTGQARWVDSCLGATWAVEVVGDVLYSGSHAHDCSSTPGGFPETVSGVLDGDDRHYHRLLAQSARDGTTTRILHWFPTTNGGIVGKLGPRDMAKAATTVWVAGEFTTVNDVAQQGLTRFGYEPAAASAAPKRPQPPMAISNEPGQVTVAWETTVDLDDESLQYTLFRGATAIHTVSGESKPYWLRPQLTYTDTGLTPGESVTYQVRATDDSGRTSVKSWTSTVAVAAADSAYRLRVLADGADLYWPLEEANSRFAGSLAAAGGAGRYGSSGVSYRTTSATPSIPGSASATLDGSDGRVRGSLRQPAPDTFSAEVWFKTTTNRGGKILGFGSSNTRRSDTSDRHVYLTNQGRLVFGIYAGGTRTLTTSRTYDDGDWHHLVVSNGPDGMRTYVDGSLVNSTGQTYNPTDYQGYWQLGGDALSGWPSAPSSLDFAGSLDEFAVYPTQLSSSTVRAHYQLANDD